MSEYVLTTGPLITFSAFPFLLVVYRLPLTQCPCLQNSSGFDVDIIKLRAWVLPCLILC